MKKEILDALHLIRSVTTPHFAVYVEDFIAEFSSAIVLTEELKKESLGILSAACYTSTPKSAEYFREVIRKYDQEA